MKKLQITFNTPGKEELTISVENPKDGLTKDTVAEAAAKMVPVMVTNGGIEVQGFKKAVMITTTEEVLE